MRLTAHKADAINRMGVRLLAEAERITDAPWPADLTIYQPPAGVLSPSKAMVRSIYVMGCEGHDFIKVGFSNNIKGRLQALNAASPWPVFLIFSVGLVGKHAYKVEHDIHHRLSDKRANGEWFKADPEQVVAAVIEEIEREHIRQGGSL